MEHIKEFIKHKESKGEKAIYRVNDTRGYTYYSDDYVMWLEQQLRIHDVSGELNCEHDWLVDMYDHFGFPASRFCDKCNTREAI